jgi:hypothetical protein
MFLLDGPEIIGATICTGVAAFGIVDAAKSFFPNINRMGFGYIRRMVASLTPEGTGVPLNALPQAAILDSLKANWANGAELNSQKATAKSLVMMHLSPSTAVAVASKTNFDPVVLSAIAANIASGAQLSQPQVDINARFDLIVAALLDEAYRNSDRVYCNGVRSLAAVVAVVTALFIGWGLTGEPLGRYLCSNYLGQFLMIGLVATSLPPVAKDVSLAVSAVVKKKIQSYL